MTIARAKATPVTPLLITVEQAAATLSISPGKCWQLVRSGDLPSVLIPPRSRRVRVADLQRIAAGGIPLAQ